MSLECVSSKDRVGGRTERRTEEEKRDEPEGKSVKGYYYNNFKLLLVILDLKLSIYRVYKYKYTQIIERN